MYGYWIRPPATLVASKIRLLPILLYKKRLRSANLAKRSIDDEFKGLNFKVRRPKNSSPKNLATCADAADPPAASPVALVAAHAHVAHAVPAVEDGVAMLTLGINPLSSIWVAVCEGRVSLVDGADCVRIGLEAVLLDQLLHVLDARELSEREETDVHFIPAVARHGVHDFAVGVLRATCGVEHLLRRPDAVDLDAQDDHFGKHLGLLAKWSKHHHADVLHAERRLRGLRSDLVTVLAQSITELAASVLDLAVSDLGLGLGCGHGLCHGVILLSQKRFCPTAEVAVIARNPEQS